MSAGIPSVELVEARRRLLERIADAAARAGRDPAEIELVAVTKTVPADRVRAAVEAGFDILGENRVQEAESKVEPVASGLERPPVWHLVGPLQSNKARRALSIFDVVETVDSFELAVRLDRLVGELERERPYPVLLQVNVDADPAKAGFPPDAIERALPAIVGLPNLRVEGLMTVGRLADDPEAARSTFVALRELSERLRSTEPRFGGALSMGMTDDFVVAIEEGATIVRIGRAIFGERH